MGTILVQGRGDGKHVTLDVNGSAIRLVHVSNVPSGNCFYVIMEVEDSSASIGGVRLSKGDHLAFEFDGDLSSYSGYYRLLEGHERDQVLGSGPKPQPQPIHEEEENPFQNNGGGGNTPRPTPQTPRAPQTPQTPKPRPTPTPTPSYSGHVSENPGGGALAAFRMVFYVLGAIWGIGFGLLLGFEMFLWLAMNKGHIALLIPSFLPEGNGLNIVSAILITLPCAVFFLLSAINCFICMKHHDDVRDTRHNAVMIIGLLNLNPFAIIGGYFNYRLAVHKYKIKPAKAQ